MTVVYRTGQRVVLSLEGLSADEQVGGRPEHGQLCIPTRTQDTSLFMQSYLY